MSKFVQRSGIPVCQKLYPLLQKIILMWSSISIAFLATASREMPAQTTRVSKWRKGSDGRYTPLLLPSQIPESPLLFLSITSPGKRTIFNPLISKTHYNILGSNQLPNLLLVSRFCLLQFRQHWQKWVFINPKMLVDKDKTTSTSRVWECLPCTLDRFYTSHFVGQISRIKFRNYCKSQPISYQNWLVGIRLPN